MTIIPSAFNCGFTVVDPAAGGAGCRFGWPLDTAGPASKIAKDDTAPITPCVARFMVFPASLHSRYHDTRGLQSKSTAARRCACPTGSASSLQRSGAWVVRSCGASAVRPLRGRPSRRPTRSDQDGEQARRWLSEVRSVGAVFFRERSCGRTESKPAQSPVHQVTCRVAQMAIFQATHSLSVGVNPVCQTEVICPGRRVIEGPERPKPARPATPEKRGEVSAE